MKQTILISILCSIFLIGCNDAMEDVLSPFEVSEVEMPLSRSISEEDSISGVSPEELMISEEMKRLKELYNQHHTQRKNAPSLTDVTYDDSFWSNMYAIRELPATIKVRSKATSGSTNEYINLYCSGKGKEVVLNNSNDATKNRFYIKVLPASTGIPYLIYSKASETPLTVGYYTSNPDEKILMAAKDDNNTLMSIGWNLLRSNTYKNYYAIQSESYLGQSDPDNSWSIFYYVLEAVSGNKIRYAQRVANKAQQEFSITPDAKFKIVSLEYDIASSTLSKSTFSKTVTVKNTSSQIKDINVPFDFYEMETSFYNRNSWNVNLNFSNPEIKFRRPSVVDGNVITPEEDVTNDATFINNSYQNISKHITYMHPIHCKASSTATVTLKF